jgi:hypothetical protein
MLLKNLSPRTQFLNIMRQILYLSWKTVVYLNTDVERAFVINKCVRGPKQSDINLLLQYNRNNDVKATDLQMAICCCYSLTQWTSLDCIKVVSWDI